MTLVLPLAHHVEINFFDVVVIEPETMPEHAALALAAIVILGFIVYGMWAAARDMKSWRNQQRSSIEGA